MAFDYEAARLTAESIIANFGETGTVTKKGATGGTDAFGDPKPDEPDIVIDGIITPLLRYKSGEIDGERIIMGDAYVFFSSETSPEIGMQTDVNGITMTIKDITDLSSAAGVNIFRKLQLRK